MKRHLIIYIALLLSLTACRTDEQIIFMEETVLPVKAEDGDAAGLYVLCEGNMGSNKCTLDFLDLKGVADGQIRYLRHADPRG